MKGRSKEHHNAASAAGGGGGSPALAKPSFTDIIPLDLKNCPRYTSILNRPSGDGVGIEEMDYLQMEIESLLVNVMQRSKMLKLEMLILDGEKSATDSPMLLQAASSSSSSAAAKAASASLASGSTSFAKRFKSFNGTSKASPSTPTLTSSASSSNIIHSKANAAAAAAAAAAANLAVMNEQVPIVRNDIPELFWQSVEPYCADITDEDIKLLNHQLELNESYTSFPKLGPIQRHYALQWAEEDLNAQIKEGTRVAENIGESAAIDSKTSAAAAAAAAAASTSASNNNNNNKTSHHHHHHQQQKVKNEATDVKPDAKSLLAEGFKQLAADNAAQTSTSSSGQNSSSSSMTYGPLTQRLISALIEQNLMSPFDNEIVDYLDRIGPSSAASAAAASPMYMSPKSLAKKAFNFNVNAISTQTLERKIKKTLIEQGILDADEQHAASNTITDRAENGDSTSATTATIGNGSNGDSTATAAAAAAATASSANGEWNGDGDNDDDDDDTAEEPSDELALEIKRLQEEMKLVSHNCKQTLVQLLNASKRNIIKQDLKKRIAALDKEIIQLFEKSKTLRLSKKPLTKKDKDKAQRLIKDRELLTHALNECF